MKYSPNIGRSSADTGKLSFTDKAHSTEWTLNDLYRYGEEGTRGRVLILSSRPSLSASLDPYTVINASLEAALLSQQGAADVGGHTPYGLSKAMGLNQVHSDMPSDYRRLPKDQESGYYGLWYEDDITAVSDTVGCIVPLESRQLALLPPSDGDAFWTDGKWSPAQYFSTSGVDKKLRYGSLYLARADHQHKVSGSLGLATRSSYGLVSIMLHDGASPTPEVRAFEGEANPPALDTDGTTADHFAIAGDHDHLLNVSRAIESINDSSALDDGGLVNNLDPAIFDTISTFSLAKSTHEGAVEAHHSYDSATDVSNEDPNLLSYKASALKEARPNRGSFISESDVDAYGNPTITVPTYGAVADIGFSPYIRPIHSVKEIDMSCSTSPPPSSTEQWFTPEEEVELYVGANTPSGYLYYYFSWAHLNIKLVLTDQAPGKFASSQTSPYSEAPPMGSIIGHSGKFYAEAEWDIYLVRESPGLLTSDWTNISPGVKEVPGDVPSICYASYSGHVFSGRSHYGLVDVTGSSGYFSDMESVLTSGGSKIPLNDSLLLSLYDGATYHIGRLRAHRELHGIPAGSPLLERYNDTSMFTGLKVTFNQAHPGHANRPVLSVAGIWETLFQNIIAYSNTATEEEIVPTRSTGVTSGPGTAFYDSDNFNFLDAGVENGDVLEVIDAPGGPLRFAIESIASLGLVIHTFNNHGLPASAYTYRILDTNRKYDFNQIWNPTFVAEMMDNLKLVMMVTGEVYYPVWSGAGALP